ncbi:hypothetical protein BJ165DRAFT_1464262 [Panaeolus papilionaceus]|nr:hypothetical protein BJ165DRAFT_1464262 [Panaeolus papilionaceus]
MVRLPQLRRLVVEMSIDYPVLDSLPPFNTRRRIIPPLPPGECGLPFQSLEQAEFWAEVEWGDFHRAANADGVSAFPALKDFTMWLHMEQHSILFTKFFEHLPVLEKLRFIYAPKVPPVDLKRCLNPVTDTLKTFYLQMDFGDQGFEKYYGPTIDDAFESFFALRLRALDSLTLRIQLETGIYFEYEGVVISHALAKKLRILQKLIDPNYDNFPSLKRVHVDVSMCIYEKLECDEPDEEEWYQQGAMEALTGAEYWNTLSKNERFAFTWHVNVYPRHTTYAKQETEDEEEEAEEEYDRAHSAV